MDAYWIDSGSLLVSDELIAKSDAELNATKLPDREGTFGDLQIGTLIHSAGYAVVKEKALDGSWKTL